MCETHNIPTSWYFDDAIAEFESQTIFQKKHAYMGHQLMVTKPNDYHVLERENHSKVLFNQNGAYSLLANICRHHEAMMLKASGNTHKIICPVHKWAYSTNGELLNAPRFEKKPCLNLENQSLTSFHGLLFLENPATHYKLGKDIIKRLDMTNYQFYKASSQVYGFNWKLFMEVYLDNYHIPAIHPGLSKITNVLDQVWQISENYSAQFVKLQATFKHTESKYYQRYQALLMDHSEKKELNQDIMWLALYPNLMVERYPFATVISSIHPLSTNKCINHIEYYMDCDIVNKYPDFPEIFEAAYTETAQEDAEICELIHQGRQALFNEGKNQAGPHHPIMEQGLPSFYNFLQTQMRLQVSPRSASADNTSSLVV